LPAAASIIASCLSTSVMPTFSKFESHGTTVEPCYVFRNVYNEKSGEQGQIVKNIIKASFVKRGKKLPEPTGNARWASWEHGCPANGNGLVPKTKELLQWLRYHRKGDWHVDSQPDRSFYCGNMNVTAAGGGQGWHQDREDYGSLVTIWAAGNDSESVIRFGGKKSKDEKKIIMHSGDCMVFEGQTWHTVLACKPHTGPFKNKSSLASQSPALSSRSPAQSNDQAEETFVPEEEEEEVRYA